MNQLKININFMTKRERVLIILIFVFLLASVYLILISKPARKVDQLNLTSDNRAIALMEEKYQEQAKNIFIDYEKLIADNNYALEQITQIKNKLLDLKTPAKFKELHLNLVLALMRMENWLIDKNESEKTKSQQIIDQIKIDYSWLRL